MHANDCKFETIIQAYILLMYVYVSASKKQMKKKSTKNVNTKKMYTL